MKTAQVLLQELIDELWLYLDNVQDNGDCEYHNDAMGDFSFLLAGVMQVYLEQCKNDWDEDKWVDDCLITKVVQSKEKIMIWGIMIWGRMNTTEQWTDPFYFELDLNLDHIGFQRLKLLIGDKLVKEEITYETFNSNRSLWDKAFYSNATWDVSERNWKFVFYAESSDYLRDPLA